MPFEFVYSRVARLVVEFEIWSGIASLLSLFKSIAAASLEVSALVFKAGLFQFPSGLMFVPLLTRVVSLAVWLFVACCSLNSDRTW